MIRAFDGIHDVSSDKVVVVDAQTFLIPNFTYNGQAPDAHFWVGEGSRPGPEGTVLLGESRSKLSSASIESLLLQDPGIAGILGTEEQRVWSMQAWQLML